MIKKILFGLAVVAFAGVGVAIAQQTGIKRTPLQKLDFPAGYNTITAIAAQDIRQARRLSRQRPNVIRDNRLAVLHGPPFVHSVFERSGYRFA